MKKSYLLSKSKALEEFPMLKADKLVGAIVYYDGIYIYMASHTEGGVNLSVVGS